ncbi:type VI secretion system membrane subunit TssM [Arcobacter sp.]|uniref:type VI secretion system membrane subunit TssM n=1 Tax=Arcobacter sp. TaxID=1872629 RepID=UPI003C77995F
MKKPFYKNIIFWIIFVSFIISLLIIFLFPYLFDSFKELNFRLLLSFSLFFGTIIAILLYIVFKKEETQEILKERAEQKELENEYKKVISEKVKDLKTKFKDAVRIIKKSSLYKNRSKINYELPWYLVIGNKAEGKSTLLESSGLNFPLNVNFEKRIAIEETTTKAFQWYFSEKSVFVDIPGNYIELNENPEDKIIWKEFLKLFTKKRWRRPINGIILTISVDRLLKNEKALEKYAKDLRDRFDELSVSFMSSIPIYLMITKLDKIDGFNEYFINLSENEKDEILGVTFDENNKNIDSSISKIELESLLKKLNSSVLEKMHFEWEKENRSKIFLFTEYLSDLFDKTNLFVDICFSQTRYRKPLLLRGIYYTSTPCSDNHQQLVSIDNLEYSRDKKGLFIRKVLSDIIFPESETIKMDDNYQKKVKKNQTIALIISFVFTALISTFYINDFINQNNSLRKMEKTFEVYKIAKNKFLPSDKVDDILVLLNNIERIRKYNDIQDKSFWNLLFYKSEERHKELTKIYYDDLLTFLLPRIAMVMEQNILKDLSDFDSTWDNTKAYVMLENKPHRNIKFLSKYMAEEWSKRYPYNVKVQSELNYHFTKLLNFGFNPYSLNEDILKTARARLTKLGSERLTYKELILKSKEMRLEPFKFSSVMLNNINEFKRNDYEVPGFYTKNGFNILMKEGMSLTKNILLNNWVIGKKTNLSPIEISKHYQKVLGLYFLDYKEYWLNALSNLAIPIKTNTSSLNAQLAVFSSSDSPVLSVLKALKENTNIYTPSEIIKMKSSKSNVSSQIINATVSSQIGKTIAKEALTDIENEVDNKSIESLRNFFKDYNALINKDNSPDTTLQNSINKLNNTYQLMSSIYSSINPDFDAYKIISDRINGNTTSFTNNLNKLPLYVKNWYLQLLRSNWDNILRYGKNYIEKRFKEDVYSFYKNNLLNKYPIDRKSSTYVRLDDFSEFFKPKGILDSFYNDYISNMVSINSQFNSYSPKNLDGSIMNFNKNFMIGLMKSLKIRNLFFTNSGILKIEGNIKPYVLASNLATMDFFYDDDSIIYEHGPIKTTKIVWPPKSSNYIVKFDLFDLSNNSVVEHYLDNEWALFKIIDTFRISRNLNNSIILKYSNKKFTGSYYLSGDLSNIFGTSNLLSNFNLNEKL